MEQSVNIWTPIMNVNENNTLRYIIASKINEHDIGIKQIDDPFTKRFVWAQSWFSIFSKKLYQVLI